MTDFSTQPRSFSPVPSTASATLSGKDLEDAIRILRRLTENSVASGNALPAVLRPIAAPSEAQLIERARQMLKRRQARSDIFSPDMFGEPAWDMLLTLYVEQHGRRLIVGDLQACAGAPPSTALRWLKTLEQNGLVARKSHATNQRVVVIEMTELARTKLDTYFSGIIAREK